MRSATAASISHNDIFSNDSTGLTTTGLVFAAAGKSHSFETPTSRSPRPRAKTISVAEGRNEMRRSSVIHQDTVFQSRAGLSSAPSRPLDSATSRITLTRSPSRINVSDLCAGVIPQALGWKRQTLLYRRQGGSWDLVC